MFNPQRMEKGPWKMVFIGILYASLSLLLVKWFFAGDAVLANYSGILVVTFCVMFTIPFMYFIIRQDEHEDEESFGFLSVWRIHKDAIYAFLWLFLGFIIAFAFWYMVLQDSTLFNAQLQTYCMINSPGSVSSCVQKYDFATTGAATQGLRFFSIIENNVYVMIFTLIFSLIFGAGAVFVLAWNASVISAAVSIFAGRSVSDIPLGIARYMIHGFPEIAAYFITALAGGIFGVGIIRNGVKSKRFLHVIGNTVILLFLSLVILIFAAIIEVYLTPALFG
jgi:uncharacterized membrane protein SpoIIM required for sporulation